MKKSIKAGFTIIEIVLVLAIAGLIFLAVFVALPALQRAQRDQFRKNDVGLVIDAVQRWRGNNHAKSLSDATTGTTTLTNTPDEEVTGLVKLLSNPNSPIHQYLHPTGDPRRPYESLSVNTSVLMVYNDVGRNVYLRTNVGATSLDSGRVYVFPGVVCPRDLPTILGSGRAQWKFPHGNASNVAIATTLESGGYYCQEI